MSSARASAWSFASYRPVCPPIYPRHSRHICHSLHPAHSCDLVRRILHTYPGGWQVYMAPDGQAPQLLTVLVSVCSHKCDPHCNKL